MIKAHNKKVVLINQSTGYLMIDIVNAYAASGKYEEIVLLAGTINPIEIILNENIRIEKICRYNRSSKILKILSWAAATVQILFLISFKYNKHDLLLVSNPPTIAFLGTLIHNKYSILVFDIHPEGLAAIGIISEKSILYRLWMKFNKTFYKKADSIYTITDGMANCLAKYCDKSKIEVVPLWPSSNFNKLILRENNRFIKAHALQNQFIVLYSGNFGKGHNLNLMVDLAEKLKIEIDIKFIIIGDGWNKNDLIKETMSKQLTNILFLPYQPVNILPHSLSSAHLAFVSVSNELSNLCLPSKTYNLLKLEIPILGSASNKSDLSKLINENKLGQCFEINQIDEMCKYILKMKNDAIYYQQIKNNIHLYSLTFLLNNSNRFIK